MTLLLVKTWFYSYFFSWYNNFVVNVIYFTFNDFFITIFFLMFVS